MTNLVINTDRRTYPLELRSAEKTYTASVSWQSPQDQLDCVARQNAEAQAAAPIQSGIDITRLRFRYAIEGDDAPWRPVQVFDDGAKVYIEFPRGIAQGEMPPLFVFGPKAAPSSSIIAPGKTITSSIGSSQRRSSVSAATSSRKSASCAPTGDHGERQPNAGA